MSKPKSPVAAKGREPIGEEVRRRGSSPPRVKKRRRREWLAAVYGQRLMVAMLLGSAARAERAIALQHPDKRVALHERLLARHPALHPVEAGRVKADRRRLARRRPTSLTRGSGGARRGEGEGATGGRAGAGQERARGGRAFGSSLSGPYLIEISFSWDTVDISAVSRLSPGCLSAVSRLSLAFGSAHAFLPCGLADMQVHPLVPSRSTLLSGSRTVACEEEEEEEEEEDCIILVP